MKKKELIKEIEVLRKRLDAEKKESAYWRSRYQGLSDSIKSTHIHMKTHPLQFKYVFVAFAIIAFLFILLVFSKTDAQNVSHQKSMKASVIPTAQYVTKPEEKTKTIDDVMIADLWTVYDSFQVLSGQKPGNRVSARIAAKKAMKRIENNLQLHYNPEIAERYEQYRTALRVVWSN